MRYVIACLSFIAGGLLSSALSLAVALGVRDLTGDAKAGLVTLCLFWSMSFGISMGFLIEIFKNLGAEEQNKTENGNETRNGPTE